MRQGCKSLTQLEIMAKPPQDRAADNPWPEWPKVYKLDYGQEEAAAKFGADPRSYLVTVKKLEGDAEGNVKELVTVRIRWEKNGSGQLVPVEVPGSEERRPAQLVRRRLRPSGPERRKSGPRPRERARSPSKQRWNAPRAHRFDPLRWFSWQRPESAPRSS